MRNSLRFMFFLKKIQRKIFVRIPAENEKKRLFVAALLLKIIFSLIYSLYYTHYAAGDYVITLRSVELIGQYFEGNYAEYFEYLITFEPAEYRKLTASLGGHDSRTFFYYKILSVFYRLFDSHFTSEIMFPFLSFLGYFIAIKHFIKIFPHLFYPLYAAFFLIPTFLFWTSGIQKESLCVPASAILWAFYADIFLQKKTSNAMLFYVFTALFLLWFLRPFLLFFIFSTVFAAFCFYFLKKMQTFEQNFTASVLWVFGLLFLLPLSLYGIADLLWDEKRILFALFRNYWLMELSSKPENLFVNGLFPDFYYYRANFLQILAGAFIYPLFNFGSGIGFYVASSEQLLFLFLLRKMKFSLFNFSGEKISAFIFSLLFYIFLSGISLAYLSPNMGTFLRYKTTYSFLLWALVFAMNMPQRRDGN